MATYSFYEFSNYKKRSDVFAFLNSYSGKIDEYVLQELYANFGDDDVVNEAWEDFFDTSKSPILQGAKKIGQGLKYANEKGFFDPSKSPILQGAKEFGREAIKSGRQAAKKSYKNTRTEKGVKKIENIAAKVGEISKAFSNKFKIDPVTAAVLISAGATGGIGAIPIIALAIGLRKGSAWLAGKGMDAAWQKVTGKTPAELDEMWQSMIGDAPSARSPIPESTFVDFLENRDSDLYKHIANEGKILKGFGSLVGKGVGTVAGTVAGTFVNLGIVLARSLKNAASFMINNPVKTGTMMMAIAVGSMIGNYGTEAINSFIYEPSINQIKELSDAAKQAGISNDELIKTYKDAGISNKDINSIFSVEKQIKDTDSILKNIDSTLNKSGIR
jgi:hypothetical protein